MGAASTRRKARGHAIDKQLSLAAAEEVEEVSPAAAVMRRMTRRAAEKEEAPSSSTGAVATRQVADQCMRDPNCTRGLKHVGRCKVVIPAGAASVPQSYESPEQPPPGEEEQVEGVLMEEAMEAERVGVEAATEAEEEEEEEEEGGADR